MAIQTKRIYAEDSFRANGGGKKEKSRPEVLQLSEGGTDSFSGYISFGNAGLSFVNSAAIIKSARFYIRVGEIVASRTGEIYGITAYATDPRVEEADKADQFISILSNESGRSMRASYFTFFVPSNTYLPLSMFAEDASGFLRQGATVMNTRCTLCEIFSSRSSYPPYIEVVYDDRIDAPSIASNPRPASDILDGDIPQTFSWYYAQEANTPQSHYDIQVNTAGTWMPKVTKAAGATHQHVFIENTLPTGDLQWRVRTYSLGGTVCGEWSDPVRIYVRQTPAAPIITTQSLKPRAYFEWMTTDQTGYRVQTSDGYDSGTQYGTETNFRLPYFLKDGAITISLSVGNSSGKWSKERLQAYTVSNVQSGSILARVANRNNSAQMDFSTPSAYTALYLLRDGCPIARLPSATEGSFFDALCLGKHKYKVRGDQGNGYYTDSPEHIAVVAVPCGMLSAVDDIDWIPMRLRAGEPPSHDADISPDIAFVHYQGRTHPVAYTMGFVTKTHTLCYTLRSHAEYAKLEALAGKTVIYKDAHGACFIGIVTGIAPSYTRRVDFSVSITETDYTQEVRYE